MSNLEVGCGEKAEEEDKAEKDNDEWDVRTQRSYEEEEADHSHNEVIKAIAGVVCEAGGSVGAVSRNERMRWIARVGNVDPMNAVDHKNNEWERVAKDKFAN